MDRRKTAGRNVWGRRNGLGGREAGGQEPPVPGVFLGCLISNLLGGAAALDVVFGSLATLMGAVGSRLFRKNRYLVSLPPIAANTLIIPWVLKYAYGSGDMVWFMMITVGAGEILAVGILGQILLGALEPYREELF